MITNPDKLKDLVEWKVMRDQRNLSQFWASYSHSLVCEHEPVSQSI